MKHVSVVFMVLLLSTVGCGVIDLSRFGSETSINERITTDSFDGVIFSAQSAAQSGVEFDFYGETLDYWTPTAAQVIALEDGLVAYLESQIMADDYRYGFWEALPEYQRQYFSLVREGRQQIYANVFCAEFDYWLEDAVFVMDGGSCFFQVIYDRRRAHSSNLRINGEA